MPRLFCFGYGYSASVLATRLLARGWTVAGTCRGEEKARVLRQMGIEAVLFDGDTPMTAGADALAGATHVLSSIPPDADGDPVLRHHAAGIAALGPQWAGYLSTTGVYGDREGGWVDEDAPLEPSTERGARRLQAERQWLALHHEQGTPVHIFRLAGIYGPGRSQLDSVRAGTAKRIVKPGQVFSRIHVEDIAGVLEASFARPRPGQAYNVCDDEPAPPQDVIAHAAELLGVAPPPEVAFEDADLSPMARSFYSESKRVSNRRIREELGVALRYPTYREGLAAMARG